MQLIKKAITFSLRPFDLQLVRTKRLDRMHAELNSANRALSLAAAFPAQAEAVVQNVEYSTAQLQQDLFALAQLGFKRGG